MTAAGEEVGPDEARPDKGMDAGTMAVAGGGSDGGMAAAHS